MSIRRYCDACGREITRNYVSERLEGDTTINTYNPRTRTPVTISVIAGVNGVANGGDLCAVCVVDAVAQVAGVDRVMSDSEATSA